MVSNDKLEQLKKQVTETSRQQYTLQTEKKKAEELVNYRQQEQAQNQREMTQLVRSIFGQSELAAAKERELLRDRLDKFNHRQMVMNEQIIALNDNITDTTSLEAVYKAKREELELNYQNQKEALQRQIKSLEERLEVRKSDLESLEKDISIKTSNLEEIIAETKRKTFINEFKKTWIDKWLIFFLVGILGLIIGGALGWGIFTVVDNIFSMIGEFFGSIFQ